MSCNECIGGTVGVFNEDTQEYSEHSCYRCTGTGVWRPPCRPSLDGPWRPQKELLERVYEALEKAYERMRRPG